MKLGTYPATGLDPKLSAAVFAAPEGGVTPPVQGPFGWVILRNAKIIPGESKTFEEVKDSLKADLVKARAGAKLTDIANAFEDARGSGTPRPKPPPSRASCCIMSRRRIAGYDSGETPADFPSSRTLEQF